MSDVFKEQLVKRKKTPRDKVLTYAAMFVCVFICVILFLPIQFFVVPLGMLLWIGARYLLSFLNIEYEYIFTNGDLDIDRIYDKSRRKRIYSGDVKNIEIMVPINDNGYEGSFKKAEKKFDCTSGTYGDNTYKFMVLYKEKNYNIIFEPNDMLLNSMAPYLGQQRLVKKI